MEMNEATILDDRGFIKINDDEAKMTLTFFVNGSDNVALLWGGCLPFYSF